MRTSPARSISTSWLIACAEAIKSASLFSSLETKKVYVPWSGKNNNLK